MRVFSSAQFISKILYKHTQREKNPRGLNIWNDAHGTSMFLVEENDRKSSLQNDLRWRFTPHVQESCSEYSKGETAIFSADVLLGVARSQDNNMFTYCKNMIHKT